MRPGRNARTTTLPAVLLALAGCATGRVDLHRPIEVSDHWYGPSYEQDGRGIGRCRVAFAVYETPEGRRPAWSAATWGMNGLLFLGAGVGAGIAASTTSGGTSAALIGASAVSLVVSAFALHRADQRVADAVRARNAAISLRQRTAGCDPAGLSPSQPRSRPRREGQRAVGSLETARLE